MQYSVQRCEFVSIGPFLYPKKDQIKSKWKYTSIHPDARRRGGAAQIKWRPSIFNLGTLYELRGKDGRAFVGLLMAPLDVHSFFSLCMCVCLSLGSDIVQLAPVFFFISALPSPPISNISDAFAVFCVCVCVYVSFLVVVDVVVAVVAISLRFSGLFCCCCCFVFVCLFSPIPLFLLFPIFPVYCIRQIGSGAILIRNETMAPSRIKSNCSAISNATETK